MPPTEATAPADPVEGVAVQLGGQTAGYYGGGEHAAPTTGEPDAPIYDDGDAVIVPAPSAEYLAHTHPTVPGRAPAMANYQKLDYKRTMIPILLSVGVCMVGLGVTKWLFGEDTKLGNMPIWAPFVLFFFALVSWVFGVLMMLQVKNALDQQRAVQQPQA